VFTRSEYKDKLLAVFKILPAKQRLRNLCLLHYAQSRTYDYRKEAINIH
jgi:predicted secreted protein